MFVQPVWFRTVGVSCDVSGAMEHAECEEFPSVVSISLKQKFLTKIALLPYYTYATLLQITPATRYVEWKNLLPLKELLISFDLKFRFDRKIHVLTDQRTR